MADDHKYSLRSAQDAAAEDELEGWVKRFLASPGSDNAELAEILAQRALSWIGPVSLPISKLNRLAGPPGEPVLVAVDEDYWRDDVAEMADKVEEGWEPPPVVVSYESGQFKLEDGNHRVESLRQAGEEVVWAVIGFADDTDRDEFLAAAEDLEPEATSPS